MLLGSWLAIIALPLHSRGGSVKVDQNFWARGRDCSLVGERCKQRGTFLKHQLRLTAVGQTLKVKLICFFFQFIPFLYYTGWSRVNDTNFFGKTT